MGRIMWSCWMLGRCTRISWGSIRLLKTSRPDLMWGRQTSDSRGITSCLWASSTSPTSWDSLRTCRRRRQIGSVQCTSTRISQILEEHARLSVTCLRPQSRSRSSGDRWIVRQRHKLTISSRRLELVHRRLRGLGANNGSHWFLVQISVSVRLRCSRWFNVRYQWLHPGCMEGDLQDWLWLFWWLRRLSLLTCWQPERRRRYIQPILCERRSTSRNCMIGDIHE